jgi:hypothetical protein
MNNGKRFSFSRPFKKSELDKKVISMNLNANFCQHAAAADAVPPVASRSSISNTAASWFDGVGVNGDGVRAIFEVITLFECLIRQFPTLSNGHKARLQFPCRGSGKNKASGIDADDRVHGSRAEILREQINASPEQMGIGQDRCDVL